MAETPQNRSRHRGGRAGFFVAATLTLVAAAGAPQVLAAVTPGTPGNDVTVGSDTDNAANTFIQPPGVATKQHLDKTDVLFGRAGDDLLVGRAGSDVLVAGPGNDIAIGGPERGVAPSSDVVLGAAGADIDVWSKGDGNGTFVGDEGVDTVVVGRLALKSNGSPLLTTYAGRKVPHAALGGDPYMACTLVKVPPAQHLGEQFLLRVTVSDKLTATLRLKDVERAACPSPAAGHARVADLTARSPVFASIPLRAIPGVVGAIVSPY